MSATEFFSTAEAACQQRKKMLVVFEDAKKDLTDFFSAVGVAYALSLIETSSSVQSSRSLPKKTYQVSYVGQATIPDPFMLNLQIVGDEAYQGGQENLPACLKIEIEIVKKHSTCAVFKNAYDLGVRGEWDAFKRDVAVFCGMALNGEGVVPAQEKLQPEQADLLSLNTGKAYTLEAIIR